jgi:hypothetical protein
MGPQILFFFKANTDPTPVNVESTHLPLTVGLRYGILGHSNLPGVKQHMIFDRIKEAGMKVAMSPTTMKLLSDPRIQKAMMRALRLPSDVRLAMEKNGQSLARTFALVTREDLLDMKRNLRDLKGQLVQLQSELEVARAAAAAAGAPIEAPGNGSSAAAVETHEAAPIKKTAAKRKSSKVTRKKKVSVKRKPKKDQA